MSEVLLDQASGLRKLLARNTLRTITVASAGAGAGRTLMAANLAVALARRGQQVVVLDCATGRDSAAWLLSAEPAADVLDAFKGASNGVRSAAQGCAGVRVLRSHNAMKALARLSEREASRLAGLFASLASSAGVLLVDAPAGDLALSAAARELVLLVGPGARAMTDSYRFLKRLHGDCGRRRVHVLINRAQSPAHADRIFGNLSSTSRRFLNLPLELMGQVPDDDQLARAARMRQPVMEAFPQTGSALALNDCVDKLLRWPYPGEDGLAEFADRLIETARVLGARK